MDAQDDPEQRIRQLEQPLNDAASTSELGAAPYGGGAAPYGGGPYGGGAAPYGGGPYGGGAYVPPAPPTQPYDAGGDYPGGGGYTPVPPMPSTYNAPPYGTQYPMTGRPVSSGLRWVWFLTAGIVFAVIAITVGIVIYSVNTATHGISLPSGIPSPGGTFAPRPGMPTIVIPSAPSQPSTSVLSPGGSVSISGMGQNRTVVCNNGSVSVSGMSNTVTIAGHCAKLTVSGMQNKIVIDTADAINASGFKNQITYHSGSPSVDNSGGDNVVQQG